jgi:hypothetical protein
MEKFFYDQSKEWYREGKEKNAIESIAEKLPDEGLAEAFKVLSIWELHMFPKAIFN